jgi:hypothetical protein
VIIGIVFGSLVGVILIVFAARRLGGAPHFEAYEIDGGTVSLIVPWPRGDIRLPVPGIDGISVERGIHYLHPKGGKTIPVDVVWVQLTANGHAYASCGGPRLHDNAAAGTALAAALGKPAEWRVHCPHDGRELPSTEAVVESNTTDVAGLCGAKR